MATAVDLDVGVIVREMSSGAVYAHPFVEPSRACRATSVGAALAVQARFLTRALAAEPAAKLARYHLPREATLQELSVVLTRADLPRRIQLTEPVCVPCVAVPHDGAYWVHVLPLGSVVYVEQGEELERTVGRAVAEAARVQELSPNELMERLPAQRHSLHRVALSLTREDADDTGTRAQARRKKSKARAHARSVELLEDVGTSLRRQHAGRAMPPVLGRDREIDALAGLLAGSERLSVVLVGPEDAGKSAVVHGLVARALRGGDPLGGRRIIATSGAQLVAGQSGFGELAARIGSVMRAAEETDTIVYFDNLADLLSGRPGEIQDLASAMLRFVVQGRVRIVGELTGEQLSHYETQHVGFMAALSRVTVEALNKEQTRPILEARARHVATHEPQRPALAKSAMRPLLDLCDRYLAYRAFPGKAIRLHDELRAVAEADVTETGAPKPIGPSDVVRAFSSRSGIPAFLLEDERTIKLAQIERFFAQRIIGQRDAIRRVAETICMVKANLQPPGKPLANFLFIGPTGVGKTEVAKTLAQFLFTSADRMVRFDMSEYMDPLAAERLIRGTQREEGELTRRVRQQPFCVVLLDEIEKAHPAVFDLLLQVCGEGRLSDARGRTTWFNNAIIIMTSNLGAAHRRPGAGFGTDAEESETAAAYFLEQVDKHFRPEFVGRLDRVIPFAPLRRDEVSAVANVALAKIAGRDGLLTRSAALRVAPAALDHVAGDGYSPDYGARALRRHLESALVGPISAVMAKHAATLDGAHLVVDRAGVVMPAPVGERTVEATEEVGGLSIAVHRPRRGQQRRGVHDLRLVATLRRTADRCAHGPLATTVRERVEYLVADLAGTRPGTRNQGAAALAAEQGRLRTLLDAVDDAVAAIADAEELAMAAVVEGAEASLFLDEARTAFAEFEGAFVRLAHGVDPDDGLAFFVQTRSGEAFLDVFLEVLFEASRQRGWTVAVHGLGDAASEPDWPTGRYGPPRSLRWWKERRAEGTVFASARVLVRVRGSMVPGLLGDEVGLWRVELEHDKGGFVEMIPMSDQFGVSAAELNPSAPPKDDPFAPPELQTLDVLKRERCVRTIEVRDDGWSVQTHTPPGRFVFATPSDYAQSLERVQFAARAEAALQEDEG